MAKQITCPRCKEVLIGDDEAQVVAKMQEHARDRHNGHEPPVEQILKRVVEAT